MLFPRPVFCRDSRSLTVCNAPTIWCSELPGCVPATKSQSGSIADNHVYSEIKTMDDLLPPGAQPGTVPTDAEQSTGLERLELLGKMQGIDIFDMRPLDASRLGML